MKHTMESKIFLTADTHFGHQKMLEERTEFSSVAEMDECLIDNWNEIVRPHDTVLHLGDFTLSKNPEKYKRKLNGHIYLVPGNHDEPGRLVKCGFAGIMSPIWEVRIVDHEGTTWPVVNCHYPMWSWPKRAYGSLHFFGHTHTKHNARPSTLSLNVGVDNNDYEPVNFTDAVRRAMVLL